MKRISSYVAAPIFALASLNSCDKKEYTEGKVIDYIETEKVIGQKSLQGPTSVWDYNIAVSTEINDTTLTETGDTILAKTYDTLKIKVQNVAPMRKFDLENRLKVGAKVKFPSNKKEMDAREFKIYRKN